MECCSLCGKTYVGQGDLDSHMENVHDRIMFCSGLGVVQGSGGSVGGGELIPGPGEHDDAGMLPASASPLSTLAGSFALSQIDNGMVPGAVDAGTLVEWAAVGVDDDGDSGSLGDDDGDSGSLGNASDTSESDSRVDGSNDDGGKDDDPHPVLPPAVAGGARGLTPSERRSNYVQVQLGFLGLLQDPLKQSETSPAARAQLDMTEAFMEGGYTGSAGEAKLLSFMKHHHAASADMVSAYKNKKNLRGLVSGRLIPVSVALVGGGVFTWLIQDIVSIAARQLVDAVLMGDRGCRTEACASTVGGETFFTDFMDARQAACMQEDFANEAGSESVEEDGAQRTPRRRLLVPFGLYLDGSALDSNGNAVALPLVFINQFFSAKMHVDHPGLAEVIACVLCSMVASRRFA